MTSMIVDGVEYYPRRHRGRALRDMFQRAGKKLHATGSRASAVAQASARPLARHLADHGYTVAAMGCWDAGWFTHSTFSGLLWTAITLIAFELKVSEE